MAKSKKAKDADEVKNYIMKLSTSDIEFCLVSPMADEIGRLKACIRDINNDRKKRHRSPLFYRFR